jgi:hypothetical protein
MRFCLHQSRQNRPRYFRVWVSVRTGKETAGPSTSVGMTILWYPQHVNRDTVQPNNRIVIPTEVEGSAVSFPVHVLRISQNCHPEQMTCLTAS